jgi:hypothetical protein
MTLFRMSRPRRSYQLNGSLEAQPSEGRGAIDRKEAGTAKEGA